MRSYGQYCSLAKALDAVGDRWSLLVVRELWLRGECRYTDLLHGLPGIATNLLADRLRQLEAAGVIERADVPPPVASTVFRLTEAGRELEPALVALARWGTRFMADDTGPAAFKAHWLAFPVAEYLVDSDPGAGPVTVVVRVAGEEVVIRADGGRVNTGPGPVAEPNLVVEGPAHPVMGLLVGQLSADEAAALGVDLRGDGGVLDRLRPSQPAPA